MMYLNSVTQSVINLSTDLEVIYDVFKKNE